MSARSLKIETNPERVRSSDYASSRLGVAHQGHGQHGGSATKNTKDTKGWPPRTRRTRRRSDPLWSSCSQWRCL